MKIIEEQRPAFIALDGTAFLNLSECIKYEIITDLGEILDDESDILDVYDYIVRNFEPIKREKK